MRVGGWAWRQAPGIAPRRATGARGWQRLSVGLLALVVLTQAACGQQSIAMVNRLQSGSQAISPALASAAQLAQAQMAATRQHLLLVRAADYYLARLSLDDQIGQMLLNEMDGTVYSPDMAVMVEQQHIGGMIVFGDNLVGTYDQARTLFATIQAHAPIPLFIATDQEGGGISRIGQFFGSFPSPRALGDSGSLQMTYNWGRQTAQDLQQLNINTNFAPVVDVSVNGGEPWSATRTFSEDPKVVATYATASMNGERSVGEVTGLKHFPGLGSITEDPHLTLPVVNRSLDQLWSTELYPYKAMIATHPDMIMATDIVMTAVDGNLPAELSPLWINGILRQQMGYQGVVITDALWMKGISNTWDLGRAAVLSILAGCDIMIAAYSAGASQGVIDAIKAAIASGQISPQRIAESVRRILMLKIQYGMLPIPASIMAAQPVMNA